MRPRRSIFKPKAKAQHRIEAKGKEATVYIYDEISWFGVDASEFVKDLSKVEADTIHLRINSPGGSVFDGMAIYNSLKQHNAKVITHIDGLAASISSVIALAGDEIVAGEGAYMMIHSPWSIVAGDSEDLRKEADLLDKVGGTISEIYQHKTGKDADEINNMMMAETWLTGAEALESHFIDKVETSENAKNKAILFDLSVFANTPDDLLEDPVPTVRGIEKALRDVGLTQQQAKALLADGLPEDLRDVVKPETDSAQVSSRRDVAKTEQRDVEQPEKKKKDRVADLLIRAEKIKSTLNEGIDE